MPPSHHSSSSHSSHSSHSHHSSSHSHSSSRSYHSSSSHSSSYRSSAASTRNTRIITPIYRARSNQPLGYTGTKSPRVYRCKNHDYVHYDHPWTDESTGQEYRAGYYDEDGNFYEDIVFSDHGKILDTATAVCRCDYCRMEDSRVWADREKPCTHCGGTMTVISQTDELESAPTFWNPGTNRVTEREKPINKKLILILVLVFLAPCILSTVFATIGAIFRAITGGYDDEIDYYTKEAQEAAQDYNEQTSGFKLPDLGDTVYLFGDNGEYTITTQEDFKANHDSGSYKKLVLDSDGNYYDKETDGYAWLNTDIDPPQFQYWFEGISSEYGDYGWMEYDEDEDKWYIEVSENNWQPMDSAVYEKNMKRLWHIDYDFTD